MRYEFQMKIPQQISKSRFTKIQEVYCELIRNRKDWIFQDDMNHLSPTEIDNMSSELLIKISEL